MPRTGTVCCPFKTTFLAEIPVDNLGDLIMSPFTCIVSERVQYTLLLDGSLPLPFLHTFCMPGRHFDCQLALYAEPDLVRP